MRRLLVSTFIAIPFSLCTGCSDLVQLMVDRDSTGSETNGITYYVGGAGPIGHVGSLDVPGGLHDAGYEGRVKVFAWQSWTHAGDQIRLNRNRAKAAELAREIRQYRRRHPQTEINIIALSAGTGIAAFALEFLPERIDVNNVFFLGCSLSSKYDLTRAMRRIKGNLYVLYHPTDRILRNVVWYTGTVDRKAGDEGIAGLEGFYMPASLTSATRDEYVKIQNVPYRLEFSEAGYRGGHTSATSRAFVRRYLATALMNRNQTLLGDYPEERFGSSPQSINRARRSSFGSKLRDDEGG